MIALSDFLGLPPCGGSWAPSFRRHVGGAHPPFGGTAQENVESTSLVKNPLPDCLIQVVNGVYGCTPHPPEDEWLVKKLYEVAGEWEEDFGTKWRPPWARHLPAKRWEYYHPNPLELLRHQALNNWNPDVENLKKNNDELLEDLKKKRKKCNDEFALASEEFKRRKSRLVTAVELVTHRNKVAQATSAPPREEYLDGLNQADELSCTQKEKYLDELLKAGLQEIDQDKIEYTQLYPVAEGEGNGDRGSSSGSGSSGGSS